MELVPTSISQRPESITDLGDPQEKALLQKHAHQYLRNHSPLPAGMLQSQPLVRLITTKPWISVVLWESWNFYFVPTLFQDAFALSLCHSLSLAQTLEDSKFCSGKSRNPEVTKTTFLPSCVRAPETNYDFTSFPLST